MMACVWFSSARRMRRRSSSGIARRIPATTLPSAAARSTPAGQEPRCRVTSDASRRSRAVEDRRDHRRDGLRRAQRFAVARQVERRFVRPVILRRQLVALRPARTTAAPSSARTRAPRCRARTTRRARTRPARPPRRAPRGSRTDSGPRRRQWGCPFGSPWMDGGSRHGPSGLRRLQRQVQLAPQLRVSAAGFFLHLGAESARNPVALLGGELEIERLEAVLELIQPAGAHDRAGHRRAGSRPTRWPRARAKRSAARPGRGGSACRSCSVRASRRCARPSPRASPRESAGPADISRPAARSGAGGRP